MPYYEKCPDCGANLDPGERCDCKSAKSVIKNTKPESQFLSVADVAKRWAVSTDLVYELIRKGDLAAMKVAGTTWRVPIGAVVAYENDSLTGQKKGKREKTAPRGQRNLVLRL